MSNFGRVLLILAIGVVLLVGGLFALNMFMAWRADATLNAKLAKLQADGEPVSLAGLKPKQIPADENAAVYLARIAKELEQCEKEMSAFENTRAGKAWYLLVNKGELPNAEQVKAMNTILDAHPAVFAALHSAAACSQYASLENYNVKAIQFLNLPNMQHLRQLARFVEAKSTALIADHKYDEATKLGMELLKVSDLYGNEPMLVNWLVSIAVRGMAIQMIDEVLQRGTISPELRAQLDAQLATQDRTTRPLDAMRSERAMSMSMAGDFNRGVPGLLHWPLANMQSAMLDLYDEMIPLADKQWFEVNQKLGQVQAKMAMSGGGGIFNSQTMAASLLPSVDVCFVAANRDLAELRCLRILNALTAFSQKNGKDAASLEELNLPKAATIDPFSGQPLKFKRIPTGWLVYSVMKNGTDEGGKFDDMQDYGVGPPGYGYDPTKAKEDTDEGAENSDDAARDNDATDPPAKAVDRTPNTPKADQ